jgi:hypothetical protein
MSSIREKRLSQSGIINDEFKSSCKDRFDGRTIAEHIKYVPDELDIDAVGIWQIVRGGRHKYELSGADLTEFVRRCVAELLAHGAKPVSGGKGTDYDWIYQPQYGETNEEIVESVVKEWLASGSPDSDFRLWFALPSPYVGYRT